MNRDQGKDIGLWSKRVREDKNRGIKDLPWSDWENMASARNVIDSSKVCENTLRIGPSLCLLTLHTPYLAQGLENIKYVFTVLKV